MACTFSTAEFQKWSEPGVLCTFWLGHVLRATTVCTFRQLNFQEWSEVGVFWTFWLGCTFSTSQLPKVVRTCGALYILTWVHCFDISTSKSGPTLVCLVPFDLDMCFARQRRAIFRSSGATNHWKKHSESWLSYLFAHLHLLSSPSFSSLIFSLLFFSSLTLPTSAFPSLHIVGSLTSQFPSTQNYLGISAHTCLDTCCSTHLTMPIHIHIYLCI